jgi:hypothetical protein
MGRPRAPLPVEKLEPAFVYLQRALDRKADLFGRGSKETRRSLASLRSRALTLRRSDFAAEANAWLDMHLTPAGRRTMLAALRRQVADALPTRAPTRTLKVPASVHEDLVEAARAMGLTVAATLASAARLLATSDAARDMAAAVLERS